MSHTSTIQVQYTIGHDDCSGELQYDGSFVVSKGWSVERNKEHIAHCIEVDISDLDIGNKAHLTDVTLIDYDNCELNGGNVDEYIKAGQEYIDTTFNER